MQSPGPVLRSTLLAASALVCPAAAQSVGVNVLPLRAVLHDDVRLLWLGDSYSIPYEERVPGGSLLSWRIDALTAIEFGDGPNFFFVKYDVLNPAITSIDGTTGYRLFETGPDAMVRFGLPTWKLREFSTDAASATPIDLLRYRVTRTDLLPGFHGPFVSAGQTASVRTLFLDPPGAPPSLPGFTLAPVTGSPIAFDPRTETRPKRLAGQDPEADAPAPAADGHISASPADLPLVADASGNLVFTLSATAPAGGTWSYAFPAGLVSYRTEKGERLPGLYFSALADSSWSYEGFGIDTPSGTPGAITKTYSREQLAHWLDVTTIDPAQPVFAFYLVNVEDIEPALAAQQMEAMVDQTAAAAADAGLGPVHHCIVIPWMHRIEGQDILGRHEEQRDAAFALALSRPDVSAVSIYDFTEGHWFTGTPESRQWLADNGYDAFTYGSVTVDLSVDGGGASGGLLDIFRSHPQGQDAGAFFAHVIERIIVDACPADFAAPRGVLDLADISGFLTRFLEQRPSADLAAPIGVLDLADVSAFIGSFLSGCTPNP